MKLSTFNAENTPITRKGVCKMLLSRGSANMISKAACELMNLQEGDEVALSQDEENPGDWYLSLAESGYTLRKKNKGALEFSSAALANMVLDNLEIDAPSAAFLIGSEPVAYEEHEGVEYWPLVTSKPIFSSKRKNKA